MIIVNSIYCFQFHCQICFSVLQDTLEITTFNDRHTITDIPDHIHRGKMRHSNFKVVCSIILVSSSICIGAGRRRMTPRPSSNHKPFKFQQWSTLPAIIPPTPQPHNRFGTFPNRLFNSNSAATNSEITQREGDNKIICRTAHEIFSDPQSTSLYKVCIPYGRNWILYTYRCPNGTEFNKSNHKCILMATTLPPTTSSPSSTTPVHVISDNGSGEHSNEMHPLAPSSPVNTTSTATNIIEIVPESSMENWESSSSSSEETTNTPAQGVSANTTTTTSTTTTTPKPKPLSNFVQNLVNQGSNHKNLDRFSILTKYMMNTMRPEQISGYKNKFSTYLMHGSTSSLPFTSTTQAPTNIQESDNVIWESSQNYVNRETTPRGSLTRWKLPNYASSPQIPGRFPGLRPSPVA